MDPKDLEELMRSYSRQSTGHLQEIFGSSNGNYREEAVEAAKRVLAQREAGVPDPTIAEAARAADVGKNTDISRYFDAYITARAIIGVGKIIKMLGIVLAVLIAIGVFAIGVFNISGDARDIQVIFGGLILSAAVGVPIFVLGILVSAQGQILMATLDIAVCSSPFLADGQRASIMSIKH